MESRIARLCIDQGLKMTGQRRVIARVLSEAEDHPDVEELYRRASALDARISIATVYRTVRLLEERGILERRDFGGGRASAVIPCGTGKGRQHYAAGAPVSRPGWFQKSNRRESRFIVEAGSPSALCFPARHVRRFL